MISKCLSAKFLGVIGLMMAAVMLIWKGIGIGEGDGRAGPDIWAENDRNASAGPPLRKPDGQRFPAKQTVQREDEFHGSPVKLQDDLDVVIRDYQELSEGFAGSEKERRQTEFIIGRALGLKGSEAVEFLDLVFGQSSLRVFVEASARLAPNLFIDGDSSAIDALALLDVSTPGVQIAKDAAKVVGERDLKSIEEFCRLLQAKNPGISGKLLASALEAHSRIVGLDAAVVVRLEELVEQQALNGREMARIVGEAGSGSDFHGARLALEEGSQTVATLSSLYSAWADKAPRDAASAFAESKMRDEPAIAAAIANRWYFTDPSGATTWVKGLEPGQSQDSALAVVARQVASVSLREAVYWVQSISNDDERLKELSELQKSAVRKGEAEVAEEISKIISGS